MVFDIETTGLDPARDSITEIGAVVVEDGNITGRFHSLVNPEVPIPEEIVELTGITDEMVKDCPTASQVIPAFGLCERFGVGCPQRALRHGFYPTQGCGYGYDSEEQGFGHPRYH